MNYIAEMNGFYARLPTRPLSSDAQALWCVLMHLCNRCGWPGEFCVAAKTLQGLLGFSYSSLSRSRSELVQAGLIEHLPQSGRRAPHYRLRSLAIQCVDKDVDKL